MKKSLLALLILIVCSQSSFAQVADTSDNSKSSVNQYVGVQLNALIKQVFNSSTAIPANTANLYMLTYSVNDAKTGWGLRFGAGYNHSATANDIIYVNANNAVSTSADVLQLRLGIEKAFKLTRKWSAGVGIDGVYNYSNSSSSSNTSYFNNNFASSPSDTVIRNSTAVVSTYGGGVMCWLRYNVNRRVLVGTETSFYYTSGKSKQNLEVTQNVYNQTTGTSPLTTNSSNTNKPVSSGTFSQPVVFYILVKF